MNPRYFYLRDHDGHPVGCFAMAVEGGASLACAASLCSPSDTWSRTAARDKALGRLRSKKHDHKTLVDLPDCASDILSWLFDSGCSALKRVDMRHADATFEHLASRMLPQDERPSIDSPGCP